LNRAVLPTYQLLILVPSTIKVTIGKLGSFAFPIGRYIYTGSAKNNPEARIARHLSNAKRLHWHIDYLLSAPGVEISETRRFEERECAINQRTPGRILIPGFGASDCRAGCGSHLKYLD
jgi:Uri superfamily endonuclease